MAMIASLCGAGKATFRVFKTRVGWWLEIVKGDNRIGLPLTREEWVALEGVVDTPLRELDPDYLAGLERDCSPPPDADNVNAPMPHVNRDGVLEISEGTILPGSDPLDIGG